MMHQILASLAALATVATAAPALAADPAPRTASVRLADLDLSRPADQRKLARRVASATEAVCGSYANARYDEEQLIGRCRADVSRALAPRIAAARARSQVAAAR